MSSPIIISDSDRKTFLELARKSILYSLKNDGELAEIGKLDIKPPELGKRNLGVFVTLHIKGSLRGCIGFIEGIKPLEEAIVENAYNAAFEDPRFEPLTEEELKEVKIEVSVLTKPELVEKPYESNIEIGKHGLIVEKGMHKGLLLPQVFPEYNANPIQALQMTCQKAMLPEDAWKDEDCKVYSFSAIIFTEE